MKLQPILILTILLFATACHKREYPPDHEKLEKEDMFFNGVVGNDPINLTIGTDGYYCYSSYNQRPDSIYLFEGELRKYNCDPCPISLQLELSDYRKRPTGSSVSVDTTFMTGSRDFMPALPKSQSMKFGSYSNKTILSQRWDLSNGKTFQGSELNYEFDQPGLQTVSLTIQTTENCISTIINKIFVGAASGVFACGISASNVLNNFASFTSTVIGGKAPYEYTWSFGDGTTSTQPSEDHTYPWIGGYPVRLQIKDADGHICEANFIHVTGKDNSTCAINMIPSYTGTKNSLFNKALVQWTDQSNTIFRSDLITQPADSYFEILESKDYEPNQKGQAGRLLTVRFNVLLSDGSRKLTLKCERAAIAVAYK